MKLNPNYLIKLKHILIPFTIVAWGSVLLLGFLRWWLFLDKIPILEVSEDTWQFWIPALFPWAPILIWLKPRFDRLEFKKGKDKGSWQMQGISWIPMMIMLMISQMLLTYSTGETLEIKNVKEIRKHERVRYYRIREFAVHKFIGGVQYTVKKNGRYNQNLDIDIYFTNPILTHKKQIISMTPLYWYGVKFHKQISNLSGDETKQRRFREFFDDCVQKMEHYDFYRLDHFEHKPASTDRENFRIAVQNAIRKPVNNDFMILQAVTRPVDNRISGKLAGIFAAFAFGIGLFMLMLIRPRLETQPVGDA
ncbi:hypothetical protein LZD49_14900 [Dyadobacter sp. CY261]|uniref:hypothetical protein n=1 Tax=Dyadobacter sp. CY261 TaxID=2907203 RepID=UPI001F2541E5|nr:hypothetical protein [Dyadobacter sp. CY261]MCF0071764.1 hypothetical protein [Dyadobacter sp. CY261]